jgi:hypothetical protein
MNLQVYNKWYNKYINIYVQKYYKYVENVDMCVLQDISTE